MHEAESRACLGFALSYTRAVTASTGSGGGRWRELGPFRSFLVIGALSLLGAVSLLGAAPARASELLWEGPAGCSSSDALSFELERALGVPLESAGRLRFNVRVERSESMASARLEVSSLDEPARERVKQRLLVADDCSTLVDTLAVAIGLAIGASEVQRPAAIAGVDASGASLPAAALDSSPPRAPSRPPEADERADESAHDPAVPGEGGAGLRPSVFLDVVGDGGALPNPAVGAALGLALQAGRVAARASGTLLLDQRVRRVSSELSAGADVGLGFGTLQACTDGLGAPMRWALPICVGLDLGQLWGRGVDVARARRAASWWVAPRLDAGLFWAIPGTTLRVGGWLTASAPLKRDEFVVDDVGVVHRPGPLVGRVAIGIDVSLE
jgi:hypothetical protein